MSKDKHDSTREALISAALKLFAERGYDGVSVKEICDKAKCNVSLVSYYFEGKDGLYRACLEPHAEQQLEFFEKMMKAPSNKEELKFQLRMVVEQLIGNCMQNPEVSKILNREFESGDMLIMDLFKRTFYRIFVIMTDLIGAGQKQGLIRKSIDPRVAASLLMGGVHFEVRMENLRKKLVGLTLKDPAFREMYVKNAVDLFYEGLVKDKS